MQLEETFDVALARDDVVELLCREETILELAPQGDTEIVGRKGDRITTCTHYTALGYEGEATFHFEFLMDGNIRFEKVCDGRVWRRLRGEVASEERKRGTRIKLSLEGSTRTFVPEFTIQGPMEDQIGKMARALRKLLERGSGASRSE